MSSTIKLCFNTLAKVIAKILRQISMAKIIQRGTISSLENMSNFIQYAKLSNN